MPENTDMPDYERLYDNLQRSVLHHLIEAINGEADEYARMLMCVLWGGAAADVPADHPQVSLQACREFQASVLDKVSGLSGTESIHAIPHIRPGWLIY